MNVMQVEIDWSGCDLIERMPGKVSGRPVVKGTRIMPEAIVQGYELGETLEELAEGFPALSITQIKSLIDYAASKRAEVAV
jgi:uncharacterized protein (DUF433 family)